MTVPKLSAPGWEPRLEAYLRSLEARIPQETGGTEVVDQTAGEDDGTPTAERWIYEGPTQIEDHSTGTDDAWTSLASGAPAEATQALIQFDSSGAGNIKFRKDSSSPEISFQSGSDTRASNGPLPVDLDGGDFEYWASSTLVTWEIYYCGYVGV